MAENLIPEPQSSLSEEELRETSGLPKEVFTELVELGALDPFRHDGFYEVGSVVVFKKAARLRRSFQLDTNSLALIIHFIGETEDLRRQIKRIYRTNPLFR